MFVIEEFISHGVYTSRRPCTEWRIVALKLFYLTKKVAVFYHLILMPSFPLRSLNYEKTTHEKIYVYLISNITSPFQYIIAKQLSVLCLLYYLWFLINHTTWNLYNRSFNLDVTLRIMQVTLLLWSIFLFNWV